MQSETLTEALRETLALFDAGGAPRTTPEVAEHLDLGRRSTYGRLERLVEQGRLETKKVGANARVWWRPLAAPADARATDGSEPGSARPDASEQADDPEFEALVGAVEEYAIFMLDVEGHVRTWNHGARTIKGYTEEEIVDEHFSTFYTDEDRAAGVPEGNLETAATEGMVEDEGWRVRADGTTFWANVTITAITDGDGGLEGFAKVTRDMTERRNHERRLERERDLRDRILETAPVQLVVFGADGTVERMNSLARQELGTDASEGESFLDDVALFDADGDRLPPDDHPVRTVIETGEPVSDRVVQYRFPGEERRWVSLTATPLADEDGAVERVVAAGKDITRLKVQTDRLERQHEEITAELDETFERIDDAFFALDDEWRFTNVNDTAAELFRTPAAELLGRNVWNVLPAFMGDEPRAMAERAMATQESTEVEFYTEPFDAWIEARLYPSADGLSVYFRDVTDRKERERTLNDRVRQQQVVTTLSRTALESHDFEGVMAEAAELVAGTLDADYCKVLDLDDASEELTLQWGVGWRAGIVGEATVSAVEDDSQAAHTLAVDGPVVVEDLRTETRFGGPELLTSHDVHSGISVTIGPSAEPWGILGVHDTAVKQFSEHDVDFVQSVANILATAVERHGRERELVQRREQLEALNSLNEVVQDITTAVIDQSTREEMEAAVVEGLAAAESFSFAWIGDVDGSTRIVDMRVEAGVEGYLDGITITVDPDDERSRGPTGRALLTGEVQVTQDIRGDDRHDPWRDHLERYDFRSSAAIPIVHDGTVYGALNVYADRPVAFEDAERRVLGQLGEVLGHAIAAIERKRALMSDEVVELEFDIPDAFGTDGIDEPFEGRITFDRTVPTTGGAYLLYGTACAEAMPAIDRLVGELPHWTGVTDLGDRDGTHRFELRVDEPPVLSDIASQGGHVERAVIEDGDVHLTIHLPPTGDVRSVTDVVTGAYPTATLLAQRQITRPDESTARLERLLDEDLTDRQRAALEAAYMAGFFEWPRRNAGQDVADSLGVTPPTFHQHLRKAERKVFDELLAVHRRP